MMPPVRRCTRIGCWALQLPLPADFLFFSNFCPRMHFCPRRRGSDCAAAWLAGSGCCQAWRADLCCLSATMLLAMQRAVFIKAMPLRALGATAEQAVEICDSIERRVPELGASVRHTHTLRHAGSQCHALPNQSGSQC